MFLRSFRPTVDSEERNVGCREFTGKRGRRFGGRRLSLEFSKPHARLEERGNCTGIARWLAPDFVQDLICCQLRQPASRREFQFDFDHRALQPWPAHRRGCTVLLTDRLDWSAEQAVSGYGGQQQVEKVFRGCKDGDGLGWSPMYHGTGSKIRVHAFHYEVLQVGIVLGQHALDGFLQKPRHVQRWRYDADQRRPLDGIRPPSEAQP